MFERQVEQQVQSETFFLTQEELVCSIYYTLNKRGAKAVSQKQFGKKIRTLREKLLKEDRGYSLRRFAVRVGMSPTYLSKVERGDLPPPGEEKVKTIAKELGEDPDELLALAGKVASDIPEIIRQRPVMMAKLIRRMRSMEDEEVERIFRIVEDGDW